MTSPVTGQTLIACALRNVDGQFVLIDDAAHRPIGVQRTAGGVTQTTSYIRLHFDQTFAHVGSLNITADEAMAREGVIAGASVGLSYANIYCYDRAGNLLAPSAMNWAGSNFWVFGVMLTT